MKDLQDTVRIKNLGKKELRLAHNSRLTVVPAGGEGFVSRECAIIHFGNPEVRNDPMKDHSEDRDARKLEYERVLALYVPLNDGVSRIDMKLLPSVEIYEVTGEQWTSLLDDPQGLELPAVGAPEVDKEHMLEALQAQLNRLQQQINDNNEPVAVNEDSPRPPRMKKPVSVTAHEDD